MKIKVIQPLADSKSVAEKYISALYGCSLVEFARQIEREKNQKLQQFKFEQGIQNG